MSSLSKCQDSLRPGGIYLLASFKTKHLLQMLWTRMIGSKKVIDKCYPLARAAEAHRYAESGLEWGAVVITIRHENNDVSVQ